MSGPGINNNNATDILQLISDDNLSLLRDTFKHNWPYAIQAYIFIDYWIKCKQTKLDVGIKFTSPEGRWQEGIFVAIIIEHHYCVYFFTLDCDCKLLLKGLKKTKLINWSKGPYIFAIHEDQDIYLKDILSTVGLVQFNIGSTCWYLSKDIAKNYSVQFPADVYISSLNSNHVAQMNSLWPHKFPGSENYIKQLITISGGLGVFTKKNNLLCSWITINDFGAIAFLQTLEEHKRKGYATILVKMLAKNLALNNKNSIAYILKENVVSQSFFKSLGFILNNNVRWIQYKNISGENNVLSYL